MPGALRRRTALAHANRFGMPKGMHSRIGDYIGSLAPGIPQLWWSDPDRAVLADQAMRDKSIKLDVPPVEEHYWWDYGKNGQNQTWAAARHDERIFSQAFPLIIQTFLGITMAVCHHHALRSGRSGRTPDYAVPDGGGPGPRRRAIGHGGMTEMSPQDSGGRDPKVLRL